MFLYVKFDSTLFRPCLLSVMNLRETTLIDPWKHRNQQQGRVKGSNRPHNLIRD